METVSVVPDSKPFDGSSGGLVEVFASRMAGRGEEYATVACCLGTSVLIGPVDSFGSWFLSTSVTNRQRSKVRDGG